MGVLSLQARAFRHDRFSTSATEVAGALAQDLDCQRVSIGFLNKGRMVVAAMSNTADIQHRQQQVRAIAQAMDEAVDQRDCVVYPLPPGAAALVCQAHAQLSALNGQLSVCSVPIIGAVGAGAAQGPSSNDGAGGQAQAIGALLFERSEPFDDGALQVAQDAASFVGPILALQHRLDQPVSGRLVEAVSPSHGARLKPGRRAVLMALCALALLAAGLWPGVYRVVAPGRAEGQGQHILAAPFDGFVRSALLRPGAAVTQGQVLLKLEDRDLLLEQRKWATELAQLDKKYREAHSTDDASQIVLAKSKLEQAQAQLDQVNQQLDRAQLRAPFNGVLLAGDLSQATGAPVKRGQELMTLAPSRTFRIVAEVDEQDVAALREQQTAHVLFSALDGAALPLRVVRIAPLATVADGRNVFEVDGLLDGPAPDGLRPGLRGVVRIDVAERPLGWIAWHRASQWARRTWWRLLG